MSSKRRRRRRSRRRTNPARALLLTVLAVVLVAGVFWGLDRYEKSRYSANRGVTSEDFYADTQIEVDGVVYKTKNELTSVLLEGVACVDGSEQKVEMLALILLDHNQQIVRWLELDPDTTTASGSTLRDALPAEGDGQVRAGAVLNAANEILGAPVELYVSLDLNHIGTLNRVLNGIELTLNGDYSAYDPAMMAGRTLILTDAQTELYMNPEIVLPDDTCQTRMQRQYEFMLAALEALKREARKDTEILNRLYDELDDVMVTNVRPARMLNEAAKARNYAISAPELLPGTENIDSNGVKRFEPDQQKVRSWVLDAFYKQKQ